MDGDEGGACWEATTADVHEASVFAIMLGDDAMDCTHTTTLESLWTPQNRPKKNANGSTNVMKWEAGIRGRKGQTGRVVFIAWK